MWDELDEQLLERIDRRARSWERAARTRTVLTVTAPTVAVVAAASLLSLAL